MSERDDFIAWVASEVRDAEVAVHNGDAEREQIGLAGKSSDALVFTGA
ncbi:MAG TPA: hypothetical protein VEY14_01695 [Nocardioidaceae bacterium]|jgi:hypothetical protein|nr:hypothetical protein [Nocardioidaceae bacterium]